MSERPLVSILIPTRNRWDYFRIALDSALQQTYPCIEIVVSDNSTDQNVADQVQRHVAAYPQVQYHRTDGSLEAMENFQRCIELSSGEYISFLMDDDIFRVDKIAEMIGCFSHQARIAMVTSYRQTIDGQGDPCSTMADTRRLFDKPTVVDGTALRKHVLKTFMNVIGEPTTPLFRRQDLDQNRFGYYCGRQYYVLADLATWFTLLGKGNLVYLPEPFSSFRIHAGQDQKSHRTNLIGFNEWMHLICDAHQAGVIDGLEYDRAMAHWGRLAADRLLIIPRQFAAGEPCVKEFTLHMQHYIAWAQQTMARWEAK